MPTQTDISSLFQPPETEQRECIIRARDVRKVYKMGSQEVHALRGATLDIYRGEYLSIMGPSGSGKSTLFNMIGALAKPSSGKVYIDQVDIAQLDQNELAWLRCRKVGYIFQSYNLIQLLGKLKSELGVTIISATHDLKMLQASDRIMWIKDGRIVKVDHPDNIDFSSDDFH